jgi:DNA-binding MarR family transcriptional regulator
MSSGATEEDQLAAIERGFSTLLRWGNLPRIRERFIAAGGVALDAGSYSILRRLDERGAMRLSELAQLVGLDLSTASRQVQHLQGTALVERVAVEEDRRASLLSLTDEGRGVLARSRVARRAVITELISGWSPAEREKLAWMLNRLADELVAFGCRGPETRLRPAADAPATVQAAEDRPPLRATGEGTRLAP